MESITDTGRTTTKARSMKAMCAIRKERDSGVLRKEVVSYVRKKSVALKGSMCMDEALPMDDGEGTKSGSGSSPCAAAREAAAARTRTRRDGRMRRRDGRMVGDKQEEET